MESGVSYYNTTSLPYTGLCSYPEEAEWGRERGEKRVGRGRERGGKESGERREKGQRGRQRRND